MPKTKISEYSTTNSDNTDIESINIAEGCAPSGINNAIRELMVHLKEFQTGASGDAFTFAGGTLMSGTNTISGAAVISGNINSSGSTNTFSGTVVMSGANSVALAAGTVSAPSLSANGDSNTGIFFPAADTIAFTEGGAEAARLDSSGRMLVGLSSAVTSWGSGVAQQIQSTASGVAYPGFSSYSFTNSAGAGGMINLGHSRSATVGTMTATQDGDVLGYLIFEGVNSSNALTGGAYIQVAQTGAAGASYIPGSMLFYTSNSTTGNVERARFNSTGALVFAGGTTTADGIGITFPAAQSASSNANTLDDYEEGTWTPTDVSGAGLTFLVDTSARYVKIGKRVFCDAEVWFPSTANGAIVGIGGLPFASANELTYGTGVCMNDANLNVWSFINSSTTTISTYKQAAGFTQVTNNEFSTKALYITISYNAAN